MAMNCTGVLYFPIAISLLEGVATELIEARFGLKGVAAFIKLLGKIYKEEGYYLVWNCYFPSHRLFTNLFTCTKFPVCYHINTISITLHFHIRNLLPINMDTVNKPNQKKDKFFYPLHAHHYLICYS